MIRKIRVIKWSGKVEDHSFSQGNFVGNASFMTAVVIHVKLPILCSV